MRSKKLGRATFTSQLRSRSHCLRFFYAFFFFLLISTQIILSAEPPPWSEKDTRLATEYLNLLVEKPEYGRVLVLLWELYDKHANTSFLIKSIAAQAKQQPALQVQLVHAHLLRRAGKTKDAEILYQQVLAKDAKNIIALRALADLSMSEGDKKAALVFLKQLTDTLAANDAARSPLLIETGSVAAELERTDEAIAAWEAAIKLAPENAALARQVAQLMLGAGAVDKALELDRQLAKSSDPARRLDALFDLSRLEEQADHFAQAVTALRDGMALLHFKDARYQQFFQRYVKSHERFGQLNLLKADLLKAADTKPPTEKALADFTRFSEIIVDNDGRVKWLRELVHLFPESPDYRWQLVNALMDHEGWQEAAKLLDAELKNDGTDLPALVFLRCLAHLRAGEELQAVERLRKLLSAQGESADVEKQVLSFAREKTLDELVEEMLKARIVRDPQKPESVFDLATFYRTRKKGAKLERLLGDFQNSNALSKRARINQVAAFLASGDDAEAAEKSARAAVAQNGAGRDEWLRLADVLELRGNFDEARDLLERAWLASDNAEKRADVDERLFALLAGVEAPRLKLQENAREWKMPALFTGEGFGTDAKTEKHEMPDAVRDYAAELCFDVVAKQNEAVMRAVLAFAAPLWNAGQVFSTLEKIPAATPERILRAAWWQVRTQQIDPAHVLLRGLIFDAQGLRVTASIEVEKLLLDVAFAEKNILLAMRQLELLSKLDAQNRTNYQLGIARQHMEMMALEISASQNEEGKKSAAWLRSLAVRVLENVLKDEPLNEAVLAALAQLYQDAGDNEKVLALWQKAAQGTKTQVATILENYSEALLAQRRFKEYIATALKLLDSESDVKRRREQFQRTLERLLWQGTPSGELPDEEKKNRLDLIGTALGERTRRFPFDGFWHEALASVSEKRGDAGRAFAEMKQAYYTSPDAPFSLDQLRAAAMRVGDLKSAIYFQKQITAGAAQKEEGAEWRQLVQLLEQDFRMGEADQARRRMEARFSQDAAALDELAKYYTESGQEDAAQRVHEQCAKIKPWDGHAQLQLAFSLKQSGDYKAAEQSFRNVLTVVTAAPVLPNTPVEKWPWPLLDVASENSKARKPDKAPFAAILALLDSAPGLEVRDHERLRTFLSVPRAELSELPEEPEPVRLRAIAELGLLSRNVKFQLPVCANVMERLWAHYFSGDGAAFRALLMKQFVKFDLPETRFVFAWLCVRSHGMGDALAWARQNGLEKTEMESRKNLLLALVNVLAENGFDFQNADMSALGASGLCSGTEVRVIERKLEETRQFDQALALGTAARRDAHDGGDIHALELALAAESAGRTEDERRLLTEAWRHPLKASEPALFDPFFYSFKRLWKLAPTAQDREHLLKESWSRLQQLPPSGAGILREARVLGLCGAEDASARRLTFYLSNGMLTAQLFAEPIMGRFPNGVLPGPRIDEMTHMRGYWDDCNKWETAFTQDGLAGALDVAAAAVNARNGGTPQGAKSSYEFTAWRKQMLARKMRVVPHAERIRLLREHLQTDDGVETLLDLGTFLESLGFDRVAIEIYRRLPERAPSNSEYGEGFVRVCERSWEFTPVLPYLEKIFDERTDPVFKPLNIKFEEMRERHAHFLNVSRDLAALRSLAFPASASKVKLEKVPLEVPYLRELALALEEQGDKPGALAAWEQLHALWKKERDAQSEDDTLHRAQLLVAQRNNARALEALREISYGSTWSVAGRKALPLHAKLAAEAGSWDEVRGLMNAVTGGGARRSGVMTLPEDAVIALSEVLVEHKHFVEAQSLLVSAERAAQDGTDRFRLRLEQLKISAQNKAWSPVQDRARIGVLLRTETSSVDVLKSFVNWLKNESIGPRAVVWVDELRSHAPLNATGALALSAFASALNDDGVSLLDPWAKPGSEFMQLLTMETLLANNKPQWALAVSQVGGHISVMQSPEMIRIFAALGDTHSIQEQYARIVRQSFPGGTQTVEFAHALITAGRVDLADELYSLALERMHATAAYHPRLIEAAARFLISQRRFEQAETLLLRDGEGMTGELADMLVLLYRGWGRLERINDELAKFDLPDGVFAHAVFLASQGAAH